MGTSMKKVTRHTVFHEKHRTREQADFLQKLGELLASGFPMQEALQFLEIMSPKEIWIDDIQQGLKEGCRLDEELLKAKFPEHITAQLFLAQIHGRFSETLVSCGKQLKSQEKQKQELAALLQYPLLLMVFLVGMVLSMRFILMPHMQSMTSMGQSDGAGLAGVAVGFIYYSPHWLLALVAFAGLSSVLMHSYLKRKSALQKASLFSALPLLKPLVRLYYTYRFGKEWSLLFRSGLTMQEITGLMQEEGTSQLMKEMGKAMREIMRQGYDFKTALDQFSFLMEEMGWVILHGESTGNVGMELGIFSEECLRRLNHRLQKLFQYIQPVLFLVIACMIVTIYAALLLPMFSMVKEI